MFKKRSLPVILFFLIMPLLLISCGQQEIQEQAVQEQETQVPTPLSTPTPNSDPCAPENIKNEIEEIHKFMREFDDAAVLAANVQQNQLSGAITQLQRIRRNAEDHKAPSCLHTLKSSQIIHMNTVINTLVAFLGGADQESVNKGILLARQQHDEYTLELATLLGVTVVPAENTPVLTITPVPTLTIEATATE
jgi:hypothetical protein